MAAYDYIDDIMPPWEKTSISLHDSASTRSSKVGYLPTVVFTSLACLMVSSVTGTIMSGVVYGNLVDMHVGGVCASQAFVMSASILGLLYVCLHIHAARRNYPFNRSHALQHPLHTSAIVLARILTAAWTCSLISTAASVSKVNNPALYVDLVITVGALVAMIVILSTVEKAARPFVLPWITREEDISCRVSAFKDILDESVSRRPSVASSPPPVIPPLPAMPAKIALPLGLSIRTVTDTPSTPPTPPSPSKPSGPRPQETTPADAKPQRPAFAILGPSGRTYTVSSNGSIPQFPSPPSSSARPTSSYGPRPMLLRTPSKLRNSTSSSDGNGRPSSSSSSSSSSLTPTAQTAKKDWRSDWDQLAAEAGVAGSIVSSASSLSSSSSFSSRHSRPGGNSFSSFHSGINTLPTLEEVAPLNLTHAQSRRTNNKGGGYVSPFAIDEVEEEEQQQQQQQQKPAAEATGKVTRTASAMRRQLRLAQAALKAAHNSAGRREGAIGGAREYEKIPEEREDGGPAIPGSFVED